MLHMSEYFAPRYYSSSISGLRPQSTTSKVKAIPWLHFDYSPVFAKGSTHLAPVVDKVAQIPQEIFGTGQDENLMVSSWG